MGYLKSTFNNLNNFVLISDRFSRYHKQTASSNKTQELRQPERNSKRPAGAQGDRGALRDEDPGRNSRILGQEKTEEQQPKEESR